MAQLSKRLILSYIFDWIIIIAIAAAGGGISFTTPYHRPFSPQDFDISYPYVKKDRISTSLLVIISLVAPAVIIFLVSVIFVPGPTIRKGTPTYKTFRIKLWEWNTGWMGLGLALASTFVLTEGVKHLTGKPRPDLLNRCNPDLGPESLDTHTVGGVKIFNGLVMVSSTICRQTNKDILDDGFKSFFSGHSSFSFAGLTYLTLFLCSKFAIGIPYLPSSSRADLDPSYALPESLKHDKSPLSTTPDSNTHKVLLRRQAAAPPTYLIVPAFLPIAVAIYISSTRYTDFRHRGFDIIIGALVGIMSAWVGFRWYHLPITRGAGWSWGPRSPTRAWGIGVGVLGYVEQQSLKHKDHDLEVGPSSNGSDSGRGTSDKPLGIGAV
ncbi:hypothetical protein MMC31_000928 [Peltigera leucophlebia]|nr:hypothetical protein [Peltigera leucophlebia]